MKIKLIIRIAFYCLFFLVVISAKSQTNAAKVNVKKTSSVTSNDEVKGKLKYVIISGLNNTYGYDVFKDEVKLIHQPIIPGYDGINGFTSPQQAEKVASLVIKKIKKGEMPPTITKLELKELNVLPKLN